MQPNKKDPNSTANQPDYNLYLRANQHPNEKFRDIPCGALWLGSKIINGEEKKFMTGSMESPVFPKGKLSISVWKAEPYFDGEILDFMYEISTMDDDENTTNNYASSAPSYTPQVSNDGQMPTIEIDNDEIPF